MIVFFQIGFAAMQPAAEIVTLSLYFSTPPQLPLSQSVTPSTTTSQNCHTKNCQPLQMKTPDLPKSSSLFLALDQNDVLSNCGCCTPTLYFCSLWI